MYHGNINENTRSADFCADQIDVLTNVAVITNVIIERVHCIMTVNKGLKNSSVSEA